MSDEINSPPSLFDDDTDLAGSTEDVADESTAEEGDTADADADAQEGEEPEVGELEDDEDAQDEADASDEDESIDDEPDSELEDDDSELYLDLDGEEVSLSDLREWRENGINAKKFTQLRQEDAKREQANKATEERINAQADRINAISDTAETVLKALESDDLASMDPKELKSNIESLQTKLAEDRQAAMDEYIAHNTDMLAKRNKHWIDKDGQLTEAFEKDKAEVEEYLRNEGYTDQEMSMVVDHRVRMAFQKAAKYDKLQKKIQKKTVEMKRKAKKAPLKAKPKPKPKAQPAQSAEERVFGTLN